ncbi:MAG: histidinol-phosphatase [Lachnospiraceae bacterium]|nr:histidinol-phosphatase [Candidatus Colinaster equi]
MKTNYHTHSFRCGHGSGTEEEYVLAAIDKNMDILGFSEHCPYPDQVFGERMPYSMMDEYLDSVKACVGKYKYKLQIHTGFEIEYLPKYTDFYEDLLVNKGVEYLILGAHFYEYAPNVYFNMFNAPSTESFIGYAHNIEAAMQTGLYSYVAHPDIFAFNNFAWDINCDRASDIIIEAALKYGAILEYNANGFRRGKKEYPDGIRDMYPHDNFWQKVKGTGIKVIVGSDAHEPKYVYDDAIVRAYAKLAEYNITPIEKLDI